MHILAPSWNNCPKETKFGLERNTALEGNLKIKNVFLAISNVGIGWVKTYYHIYWGAGLLAKMFAHGHPHINIKHLWLSNNNILHIYIYTHMYYILSIQCSSILQLPKTSDCNSGRTSWPLTHTVCSCVIFYSSPCPVGSQLWLHQKLWIWPALPWVNHNKTHTQPMAESSDLSRVISSP